MENRDLVRAILYAEKDEGYSYLLLKAKKGYWQNPQGGIDSGESEIEALVRETKEETGLEVLEILADTRHWVEYETERKGNILHTTLASYAARVDFSEDVKLSAEDGHIEYKWVSYDGALKMLTAYPEQIQVFIEVVKMLDSKQL